MFCFLFIVVDIKHLYHNIKKNVINPILVNKNITLKGILMTFFLLKELFYKLYVYT